MTVGIDTQIPWPDEERVVKFEGKEFLFLPQTDRLQRAVRVKLGPGFPKSAADRMILELLSALAWAEESGADTTFWTWGTIPINVGKGPFGMIGSGRFDYLPAPVNPKAKLALAIYREALSVNLVPYKFLGFFKVVNVIRDKGTDQKAWIKSTLAHITDGGIKARIAEIQKRNPDVADYLYVSGRCAVAHAFNQPVVNPDDPTDLIRLNEDLPVIQEIARIAIERELGVVSKREYRRHVVE